MSVQEKITLIKENLQEVLKEDIIEDVLIKQNRPLKIYWGTCLKHRVLGRIAHVQSQVLRQPEGLTAGISYLWLSLLTSCALGAP